MANPSTATRIDTRAAKLLGLKTARRSAGSLRDLSGAAREQLTFADLERFRNELAQTRAEFSSMINVSERTLARHAADIKRRVAGDIADRAVRLARIHALAEFVLEDDRAGRDWLARPQPGLAGRRPNDLLSSEFGAREVETLLNRIEHGVYP